MCVFLCWNCNYGKQLYSASRFDFTFNRWFWSIYMFNHNLDLFTFGVCFSVHFSLAKTRNCNHKKEQQMRLSSLFIVNAYASWNYTLYTWNFQVNWEKRVISQIIVLWRTCISNGSGIFRAKWNYFVCLFVWWIFFFSQFSCIHCIVHYVPNVWCIHFDIIIELQWKWLLKKKIFHKNVHSIVQSTHGKCVFFVSFQYPKFIDTLKWEEKKRFAASLQICGWFLALCTT